ncbi:MAG: nucleoside:proton symporter [Desulfobacteraceae bacterium 4572_19]|nr:MAG: nucleoside:proton symporter [Desulfobacteraceae bacterium 4572_19]
MIIQSIAGLFVFSLIAWVISENRSQVRLKTILIGIFIQLVIGVILLKISIFRDGFMILNQLVMAVESATSAGTSFVFGYLGGGQLPFDEKFPGAGFILAFKALPLVLVIGALSSLLFYWKILPFIVKLFSKALQKTMNLGGAEGLGVSANVFLGMVEAPLIISPYLKQMTRSEIFTLMTSGMATISGTVMVLYASILNKVIPDIMGHILIASIISVPAAVLISKIMVPETDALTSGDLKLAESAEGPMDAVTQGTIQGMQLAITIVAMLIVLIALVHLVNLTLGLIPEINGAPFTLQRILGYIMAPVVWFMGIPWNEAHVAGSLMGTKTILNEFIAYLDLSRLPEGVLSPKSILIMTYAMCGFANPGSLGIMIGGMGTMAPERRSEIVSLGFKSIIAGTLATCMTGAVVGVFY